MRLAVEREGRLHFWRAAMKPGKLATRDEISVTPVIGLPGNPAAALITCGCFVVLWCIGCRAGRRSDVRRGRSCPDSAARECRAAASPSA